VMLFKPEHAQMILRRKKTQTRRTGKKRWKVGKIYQAKTGHRGSEPFAYLLITGLRQEFLGQITDQDACREGYPHIPGYRKIWKKINGRWDPHQLVWVVDFELATEVEYQAQRKGAA